jgi:hypothetical protein
MSNFSFLVYRSSDEDVSVNAIVKDESVWLSQKAMAELFGVSKSTISRHLKNIFDEGSYRRKQLLQILQQFKWKRCENLKTTLYSI